MENFFFFVWKIAILRGIADVFHGFSLYTVLPFTVSLDNTVSPCCAVTALHSLGSHLPRRAQLAEKTQTGSGFADPTGTELYHPILDHLVETLVSAEFVFYKL